MALGGGSFTTQNKVLPGSYINFVSASAATAGLPERGTVAMALQLGWGPENKVIEIDSGDFQMKAREKTGYAYDATELTPLREAFKGAIKVLLYRLSTNAAKAAGTLGEARYPGLLGNEIKVTVAPLVDDATKSKVTTSVRGVAVDVQTVEANTTNLVDNAYVVWTDGVEITASLTETFTAGTNGNASTIDDYQAFLAAIETQSFDTLACASTNATVSELAIAFTHRLRDEVGQKFTTVVYKQPTADYEAVISVENEVTANGSAGDLVYWVAGKTAGANVNQSLTNAVYDGELTFNTDYTQTALSEAIRVGKFVLHRVYDRIRVLMDINTLVTITSERNEAYQDNKTIRTIDSLAISVAEVFTNQFMGIVPNDADGRVGLWAQINSILAQLVILRAIADYDSESVTIAEGETKNSVVVTLPITVVGTMTKLYMTVVVG